MLHTGSSSNRRTTFIFVCGIVFGFLVTYGVYQRTNVSGTVPRRITPQFIPIAPHSHGETESDNFVGPDQEQTWNDFGQHNHHDEDEVARYLHDKVRVLCWVMTSPSNIHSKARHVKATWGKRCNILLFMSSKEESSLPAIGLDVMEGRDFLWGKTRKAFQYVYEKHFQDADWFMKADDDTYVILENLRYMLSNYDPKQPIYFGRRFKPYVKQGYMSGGAGYVLSKEALRRFVVKGLNRPDICRDDPGGPEDLEIGQCLEGVGVHIEDSRDELGRERFHPFVPELHLIPGIVTKDNWYYEYSYYPAKEGPECCSDNAISFHYVPPNMMYVFEYFVYHLRPHGIQSNLVLPVGSPEGVAKYRPPKKTLSPPTKNPFETIGATKQPTRHIPEREDPSLNAILPSNQHEPNNDQHVIVNEKTNGKYLKPEGKYSSLKKKHQIYEDHASFKAIVKGKTNDVKTKKEYLLDNKVK